MQKNELLIELKFLLESGVSEFLEDVPKNHYNLGTTAQKSIKKNIPTNLNNINNLDRLKEAVINFDKCELKKTAKNTVFSDGNPKSKIMFVGEAPGADEDLQGLPFVGRAGKLLDKMLDAINLNRHNVYISNIIPWRPPGNRQPLTQEILLCLPFIQRHIELINPEILVLLGGTAAKSLLMSDEGIMRLRGHWHQYNSYGLLSPIYTRAIFHPAFLLRSPGYKKQAWEDLKAIKSKL